MILTGKEIANNLGENIFIEPFTEEQLNPNSYNLRLHDELMVYKSELLDPKEENEVQKITIPEEGLILEPGELYLARTHEYTKTFGFVPMIIGRSSMGRLGVSVHVTSGFGDIGFCGYWTLQLTTIKRVKVYPLMKICQIFYHSVLGEYDNYESNKYQDSDQIVASQIYKEFK